MPVFTIASVSGSLGVTTLSVGLALTWPRPVVLVEADPSGGSAILAGYCTGVARPGLSELVLAHRHHQLAEELPSRLFPLADSNASLLPGLRAHQQAASLLGVWDALWTPSADSRSTRAWTSSWTPAGWAWSAARSR